LMSTEGRLKLPPDTTSCFLDKWVAWFYRFICITIIWEYFTCLRQPWALLKKKIRAFLSARDVPMPDNEEGDDEKEKIRAFLSARDVPMPDNEEGDDEYPSSFTSPFIEFSKHLSNILVYVILRKKVGGKLPKILEAARGYGVVKSKDIEYVKDEVPKSFQ
ncbi:hypothetical protein Tco_1142045, partial [Tanacetum coccineum]